MVLKMGPPASSILNLQGILYLMNAAFPREINKGFRSCWGSSILRTVSYNETIANYKVMLNPALLIMPNQMSIPVPALVLQLCLYLIPLCYFIICLQLSSKYPHSSLFYKTKQGEINFIFAK